MYKDIKEKCDEMIKDLRACNDALDLKKDAKQRDLYYTINRAIRELRSVSGNINTFFITEDE